MTASYRKTRRAVRNAEFQARRAAAEYGFEQRAAARAAIESVVNPPARN